MASRFSLTRLRGALQPAPITTLALARPNGHGRKSALESGVQFVGPDWATMRYLREGAVAKDADALHRATAFATSAYCYVAMQWRATRVAEPPLMVVRETPDGEEWQPNHPLAELFDQPRPDVDLGELLQRTQLYRDLTGAALWAVQPDVSGRARLVTPFSAEEFRSAARPGLIYGAYEVRDGSGAWRPVDPAEVVHFREPNPYTWRTGASRVDVAMIQLDLGHNVAHIVRRFLQQAMFPGGVVSPDAEWHPDSEEWEAWKEALALWHAGPANAGAPLALPGGSTFSRASSGLQDLLPAAVLDRVEATVGSVFGVSPVVMGWLSGMENSPWSQMSEARRAAYEDTIIPLWDDVEKRLTRALLRQEERRSGLLVRFDLTRIRALREDDEKRARVAGRRLGWTINEMRLHTGQEPLAQGDPRGDLIPGVDTMLSAAGPGADPAAGDSAPPKSLLNTQQLGWMVFDLEAKASEGGWERALQGHLTDLGKSVAALARRTLREEKGVAPASAAQFQLALHDRLQEAGVELAELAYPLLTKTGARAVHRLARLGVRYATVEPGLLRYAREEAAFLAETMGATTGQAVAAAVQTGLEAGETVRGLASRLEELPAFSRSRAQLVARTETTRAWNGAQRRAMSDYARESGDRATKTWLTAQDDRVRDEHAAMEGETVPIDAPFSNGVSEPCEPNCRCTLTYQLTGPADAATEEE